MTSSQVLFELPAAVIVIGFSLAQDFTGVGPKTLSTKLFLAAAEGGPQPKGCVFLFFDSPLISKGVVPIARDSVESNGRTIRLKAPSAS